MHISGVWGAPPAKKPLRLCVSARDKTENHHAPKNSRTDDIMNNSLWIGLYPGMDDQRLDYMIASVREFFGA